MVMELIRTSLPGSTVWDRDEKLSVKGLHLRVLPTGKRVFYLYYRSRSGTQRRPRIGELGEITLTEARRRAKVILDRVAVGEDPKAKWDEERAELTVTELFDKVWAAHWAQARYQDSGWAAEVKYNYLNHIKGTFGGLKLSEVTPLLVRTWHSGFKKTPTAGNRCLSVLAKMFQFAEEVELRAQHTNPCTLVKAFPEKKRRRFATEDEIRKLGEFLEKEAAQFPGAVAFLYLLLFSGSRPRAIARARWDQLATLDIAGKPYGVLTFKGKTSDDSGEDEVVILPPQAMRVITRLPRIEGECITGLKNVPRKLWNRARKAAGCEDLWARDLRRTFATVGLSDGLNQGTIGELLNHKSAQTTMIYAKLMQGARIHAVTSIANQIEQMISGEKV